MRFRTIAWEIRKLGEPSQPLHPRNYTGYTITIIHDHTKERRQRSYLAISGKAQYDAMLRKARTMAHERGFQIQAERTSDAESIFTASPAGEREPHKVWRAGKAKIVLVRPPKKEEQPPAFAPSPETAALEAAAQMFTSAAAQEEKEEIKTAKGDLLFPGPQTGVVISSRSTGEGWMSRIWGFGNDREEVDYLTTNYASHMSETAGARTIPKPAARIWKVMAVAGFVMAAGAFAGLSPGLSLAASYYIGMAVGMTSAVAAVGLWAVSPVRRTLSRSLVPKQLRRVFKSRSRWGWSGLHKKYGSVFQLGENRTLGQYVDVPKDMHVVPDMGGVKIGIDEFATTVRIPDNDRYHNLVFVGAPGMGKTTGMLQVAGGDIMRGMQGEQHTPIWIETKKEGGARLMSLARKAGVSPLYITAGSTEGPTIRFLEWNDCRADSGTLTEAFAASFEPGSIHEQSRDVLAAAFDMATLVWPEHLWAVGDRKTSPNFMRTVWLLCGGVGWPLVNDLMEQVKRNTDEKERYEESRERIGIYIDAPIRERDQKMGPARNKLNRIKGLPVWNYDCVRETYTWLELMEMGRPVVLDLSYFSDPGVAGYSEELIRLLLPISLFTFWSTAKKHCSNWFQENRSVTLYCDEASNLAYNAGSILTQISNQGRSHGVSMVLGAQGWMQLSEQTQRAFRQAAHKVYFSTHDTESAESMAKDLQGENYNAQSLVRLAKFQALTMLRIHDEQIGPMLLNIPDDSEWTPDTAWEPYTAAAAR